MILALCGKFWNTPKSVPLFRKITPTWQTGIKGI
jgi:hypothetical protein